MGKFEISIFLYILFKIVYNLTEYLNLAIYEFEEAIKAIKAG